MRLSVRHRFDCTVERFWEMYWDDDFDAALSADAEVDRELLSLEDDGRVMTRTLRFTPHRTLPRPVARLLGSDRLVYEQVNRWDRERGVMEWEVIPTVLPGKLEARGTFEVHPVAGGCEQVVQGEIAVKVRLIGGQIERGIVDEVARNYERTAGIIRTWLREHP